MLQRSPERWQSGCGGWPEQPQRRRHMDDDACRGIVENANQGSKRRFLGRRIARVLNQRAQTHCRLLGNENN